MFINQRWEATKPAINRQLPDILLPILFTLRRRATIVGLAVLGMVLMGASLAYADADTEATAHATPPGSFSISYAEAEEAVIGALIAKGAGDKLAATINGRSQRPLTAFTQPVVLKAKGLRFDAATGYWEANLLFVAGQEVLTAMPIAGRFEPLSEVAMLKRELRAGDIISDDDVEIRDYPTARLRGGVVSDFAALIGKTPVRRISPNRPIRAEEVAPPAIIEKNALVTMRYVTPGMQITTHGQALSAGAKGDVIMVRNQASKKTVQAVIESGDTVIIQATGGNYAQVQ